MSSIGSTQANTRRIAIFGASGGTGRLLTQLCLARGDEVCALLRTPEKFSLRDRVRVVHGSAFDPEAVAQTLAGADVVLSALGASSLRREDVLERAVPLILAALQTPVPQQTPVALQTPVAQQTPVVKPNPTRRIIVLGSAGALPTALDKQPAWRRFLVERLVYKTLLKWPVASQVAQYRYLANSDLDWTMVMPPMLTNGPARGRYRVDADALPRNGSRISRADVAEFMIRQIDSPQYLRRAVYLSW